MVTAGWSGASGHHARNHVAIMARNNNNDSDDEKKRFKLSRKKFEGFSFGGPAGWRLVLLSRASIELLPLYQGVNQIFYFCGYFYAVCPRSQYLYSFLSA